MEKDILYIKNNELNIEIRYLFTKKVINKQLNKFLNEECLKYISTLDGRKKAMSRYWGSNYNVPIYISDGVCLLKIDDIYYINIYNVDCVFNNMIIFNNGDTIEIKKSERNIRNKVKKLKDILKNIKN